MSVPPVATPIALVFLLLGLIGAGEGFTTAVYLQDNVPESTVAVVSVEEGDRIHYEISIDPLDGSEAIELIAEPSDLVGHTFLLYMADAPTGVISTAPILTALSGATSAGVQTLTVNGEDELGVGSTLYLVRSDDSLLLTAPEVGIGVLTRE